MRTKKPVEPRRGGARPGAGRKPVASPKRQTTFKLDEDTRDRLKQLSQTSGYSQARIVEYAIKKVRKLPDKLE